MGNACTRAQVRDAESLSVVPSTRRPVSRRTSKSRSRLLSPQSASPSPFPLLDRDRSSPVRKDSLHAPAKSLSVSRSQRGRSSFALRPSLLLTPAPPPIRASSEQLPLGPNHTVLDDLRASSFGVALPSSVLFDFARFFQVLHFNAGEVIFSPGEDAAMLFLVRTGTVAIRADRMWNAAEANGASVTATAAATTKADKSTASSRMPFDGASPTLTSARSTSSVVPTLGRHASIATTIHGSPTMSSADHEGAVSPMATTGVERNLFELGVDSPRPAQNLTAPPSSSDRPARHARGSLSVMGNRRRSLDIGSNGIGSGVGSVPRKSLSRHRQSEVPSGAAGLVVDGEESPTGPASLSPRPSLLFTQTLPLMVKRAHETFGQECLRSAQRLRTTWAIAESSCVLVAISHADVNNFLMGYPEEETTNTPAPPTSPSSPASTTATATTPLSPAAPLTAGYLRTRIIDSLGHTVDSLLEQHLDLSHAKLSLLVSLFNFVQIDAGDTLMREGTMGSFIGGTGGANHLAAGNSISGGSISPARQTRVHTNNLYFLLSGQLSCTVRGGTSGRIQKVFDSSAPVMGSAAAAAAATATFSSLRAPSLPSTRPITPATPLPVGAPGSPISPTVPPSPVLGPTPKAAVHPGFIGELGLILDIPRTATISALTDCVLLELQQDRWRNFLQLAPECLTSFQQRLTSSYHIHILHLLNQPSIARAFVDFCRREFSGENYACWHACVSFRHAFPNHILDTHRNKQAADDIVERFISSEGDTPVNLRGQTTRHILSRWRAGEIDGDMFVAAEEEALSLMNSDSFPRFKASDAFQKALAEINATHLDAIGGIHSVGGGGGGGGTPSSTHVPSPQQIARAASMHNRAHSSMRGLSPRVLRRSHTHKLLAHSPPPPLLPLHIAHTISESPSPRTPPQTLPKSTTNLHRHTRSNVEDLSTRQLNHLAAQSSLGLSAGDMRVHSLVDSPRTPLAPSAHRIATVSLSPRLSRSGLLTLITPQASIATTVQDGSIRRASPSVLSAQIGVLELEPGIAASASFDSSEPPQLLPPSSPQLRANTTQDIAPPPFFRRSASDSVA